MNMGEQGYSGNLTFSAPLAPSVCAVINSIDIRKLLTLRRHRRLKFENLVSLLIVLYRYKINLLYIFLLYFINVVLCGVLACLFAIFFLCVLFLCF